MVRRPLAGPDWTAQDIAGRLGNRSRVDLRSRPQSQCIVFPLLAEADCWRLMARVGPNRPSSPVTTRRIVGRSLIGMIGTVVPVILPVRVPQHSLPNREPMSL